MLVVISVFLCFFQIDGITIGSLDDIPGDAVRSIRSTLDFDFEDENEGWFWDQSLVFFYDSIT